MTENEFKVEQGLVIWSCITCGIRFAIPTSFDINKRKDHKTFYCPDGHSMYYPSESKEDKLRNKLYAAQNCCDIQTAKARTLDYRSRYYKGKLNKMRKEVVNEL